MEDLSKLSSKELEALLEKKRAEERQQALDKRAAYAVSYTHLTLPTSDLV